MACTVCNQGTAADKTMSAYTHKAHGCPLGNSGTQAARLRPLGHARVGCCHAQAGRPCRMHGNSQLKRVPGACDAASTTQPGSQNYQHARVGCWHATSWQALPHAWHAAVGCRVCWQGSAQSRCTHWCTHAPLKWLRAGFAGQGHAACASYPPGPHLAAAAATASPPSPFLSLHTKEPLSPPKPTPSPRFLHSCLCNQGRQRALLARSFCFKPTTEAL